ncbi:MAG: hypothetical protein PHG79_04375 [Methanosarcina sp.]|nr:hypothetical protein [Methanosarcina sp.]MDD3873609.1 hypothetical protein [Methanosarcina sp.]MDD4522465.1 hypothetical protein [Methanosarcina sp.]HHV23083.1 hypothetical protein [Methanosarcina sp.]
METAADRYIPQKEIAEAEKRAGLEKPGLDKFYKPVGFRMEPGLILGVINNTFSVKQWA